MNRNHDRAAIAEDARTSGRAQIEALTRYMSETWNRGDAVAYGMLFSEDSDYVAFDGTRLVGRNANIAHHQILFDTVLKRSRLVFEGNPDIRFLTDDVAVMHAMGSVLMPWQEKVTARRRSIQTYVARREADNCWRFTAFHNTRYRPTRLPSGKMLAIILALMRLRTAISGKRGSPV